MTCVTSWRVRCRKQPLGGEWTPERWEGVRFVEMATRVIPDDEPLRVLECAAYEWGKRAGAEDLPWAFGLGAETALRWLREGIARDCNLPASEVRR